MRDLWQEPAHEAGRSVQDMAIEGSCAQILLILQRQRMADLSERENSRICLHL